MEGCAVLVSRRASQEENRKLPKCKDLDVGWARCTRTVSDGSAAHMLRRSRGLFHLQLPYPTVSRIDAAHGPSAAKFDANTYGKVYDGGSHRY